MANISSLLNNIKNAIYGRDMRSAIHDSIKAVNDEMNEHKSSTVLNHPNGCVTTEKIAHRAVEREKIKIKAVGTDEIDDDAIVSRHIGDKQVTTSKLADKCITNYQVNYNAIQTYAVAKGAITKEKLADELVEELSEIPVAGVDKLGCVKIYGVNGVNRSGLVIYDDGTCVVNTKTERGITRDGVGQIGINPATQDEVDAGTEAYKPVTPATLKTTMEALKNGLRDESKWQSDMGITYNTIDSIEDGIYSFYGDGIKPQPYNSDGILLQVNVEGIIHQIMFTYNKEVYMRVKDGDWDEWSNIANAVAIYPYICNLSKFRDGTSKRFELPDTDELLLLTVDVIPGETVEGGSDDGSMWNFLLYNDEVKYVFAGGEKLVYGATYLCQVTEKPIAGADYHDGELTIFASTGTNSVFTEKVLDGAITKEKLSLEVQDELNSINTKLETVVADNQKLQNYSTTPQRIGTWIDGTPVWRVAFEKILDVVDSRLPSSLTLNGGKLCFKGIDNAENVLILNSAIFVFVVGEDVGNDEIKTDTFVIVNNGTEDTADFQIVESQSRYYGDMDYVLGGYIEFVTPESNITTT